MPDSISLKIDSNIAVAMRDGVTLYADIYRPDNDGPFPTILQRTPYDKSTSLTNTMLDPIRAAKAGFAVVIQDTPSAMTLMTGMTRWNGRLPKPGQPEK